MCRNPKVPRNYAPPRRPANFFAADHHLSANRPGARTRREEQIDRANYLQENIRELLK
jgi:hypothetical protein